MQRDNHDREPSYRVRSGGPSMRLVAGKKRAAGAYFSSSGYSSAAARVKGPKEDRIYMILKIGDSGEGNFELGNVETNSSSVMIAGLSLLQQSIKRRDRQRCHAWGATTSRTGTRPWYPSDC